MLVKCSPPGTHTPRLILMDESRTWRKVLYEEQNFGDSFVDETFLESLIVNANLRERSYWQVVCDTTFLTQQLATVASSISVTYLLYQKRLSSRLVISAAGIVLFLCMAALFITGIRVRQMLLLRGIRQTLLLTSGVYLLSPLLQTLTRSLSSDTVITTSCWLLLIHVYLQDYHFVEGVTESLAGSISLGSAIFASVLLASRLHSPQQVFVQVVFSLELYLLGPYARRYVKQISWQAHIALTWAMVGGATRLVLAVSSRLAAAFLLAIACVTYLYPLWLVRAHKFKAKINGPWDEATPCMDMTVT